MALTADQAAEVARRHGLTLNDAAALMTLADDETSADRLAASFTTPAEPARAATRQFVKDLFAEDAPRLPVPNPTRNDA